MKEISVDKDVYNYLQKNAIPFEEDPNTTLRRLFKLDINDSNYDKKSKLSKKKPKTSLWQLKTKGFLVEGQNLHFRDYQRRIVPGFEAKIVGGKISFKNQTYSMSELAVSILKELGFSSDYVRGPQFWYTSDNKSIKELWEQHLNNIK